MCGVARMDIGACSYFYYIYFNTILLYMEESVKYLHGGGGKGRDFLLAMLSVFIFVLYALVYLSKPFSSIGSKLKRRKIL